jgi:hypothetical protein
VPGSTIGTYYPVLLHLFAAGFAVCFYGPVAVRTQFGPGHDNFETARANAFFIHTVFGQIYHPGELFKGSDAGGNLH